MAELLLREVIAADFVDAFHGDQGLHGALEVLDPDPAGLADRLAKHGYRRAGDTGEGALDHLGDVADGLSFALQVEPHLSRLIAAGVIDHFVCRVP